MQLPSIQFSLKRISTVGPKTWAVIGMGGYLRPDQFLDHLTVIKIVKFAQNSLSQSRHKTLPRDFKILIFRFVPEVPQPHLQN